MKAVRLKIEKAVGEGKLVVVRGVFDEPLLSWDDDDLYSIRKPGVKVTPQCESSMSMLFDAHVCSAQAARLTEKTSDEHLVDTTMEQFVKASNDPEECLNLLDAPLQQYF